MHFVKVRNTLSMPVNVFPPRGKRFYFQNTELLPRSPTDICQHTRLRPLAAGKRTELGFECLSLVPFQHSFCTFPRNNDTAFLMKNKQTAICACFRSIKWLLTSCLWSPLCFRLWKWSQRKGQKAISFQCKCWHLAVHLHVKMQLQLVRWHQEGLGLEKLNSSWENKWVEKTAMQLVHKCQIPLL